MMNPLVQMTINMDDEKISTHYGEKKSNNKDTDHLDERMDEYGDLVNKILSEVVNIPKKLEESLKGLGKQISSIEKRITAMEKSKSEKMNEE